MAEEPKIQLKLLKTYIEKSRENVKPREPSCGRCRPLTAKPSTGRGGMEQRQAIRLDKRASESARQASREKKKIEQNQPAHNRPILGSQGALRRQAEVKTRTCRSAAKPSTAKKKRLKQQYLRKDSSGSCKIYPPWCSTRS